MKSIRFTRAEGDALVAIANERLAGGVRDLADALALTEGEAEDMVIDLERAVTKLQAAGVWQDL